MNGDFILGISAVLPQMMFFAMFSAFVLTVALQVIAKNIPERKGEADDFARMSSKVIMVLAFSSAGTYLSKLGYLVGQGETFAFPFGVEAYPYGGLYTVGCVLLGIRFWGLSRSPGK